MKKKQIVDLIISVFLIVCGSVLLLFPLFHFVNVKIIFLGVIGVYVVLSLIKFGLTYKSRDFEGLLTSLASIIVFIVALKLDINKVPWYLALCLLIWIILLSLIKLNKGDYYNDRKNKMWIVEVISLVLFILAGLLTTMNLYYENDIQVLILGYFFLIHGMLELFDPLIIGLQK